MDRSVTILGIDTSARTCTACLYADRVLSSYTQTDGPTHSQQLLPAVRQILDEGNCSVAQLDAISVSVGPGSFTGLRIGISAVKGLSFSRRIPCVPVSTLEALATNAADYEGFTVCALMDARRGEFYYGLFSIRNGIAHRLKEDCALSGETIAREIASTEKRLILGDGAEKFVFLFSEFAKDLAPLEMRYQKGESVAILGRRLFLEGKWVSCHALSPSYLRLPQAEREWNEKHQSVK